MSVDMVGMPATFIDRLNAACMAASVNYRAQARCATRLLLIAGKTMTAISGLKTTTTKKFEEQQRKPKMFFAIKCVRKLVLKKRANHPLRLPSVL